MEVLQIIGFLALVGVLLRFKIIPFGMAATFEWDEANGVGETVTHGVTTVNWKNADTATGGTDYQSYPISDGSNSFEKWQYGHFSGTYNQISNGLFAHTAGACDTGITLYGPPAMTADGDKLSYATPATTTNSNLTTNMTSVIAITSGVAVWFGATSPTGTKTSSTTSNPAYTNYLTTQLRTSGASPGDMTTLTLTLRYDEN